MLERFYPKEYLDSTYMIDFEKLYNKGYRGVMENPRMSEPLHCF